MERTLRASCVLHACGQITPPPPPPHLPPRYLWQPHSAERCWGAPGVSCWVCGGGLGCVWGGGELGVGREGMLYCGWLRARMGATLQRPFLPHTSGLPQTHAPPPSPPHTHPVSTDGMLSPPLTPSRPAPPHPPPPPTRPPMRTRAGGGHDGGGRLLHRRLCCGHAGGQGRCGGAGICK